MKHPAAIFDMDGSLCDVSSVRYHVNPNDPRFSGTKRFDLFHAGSIDCPPNKLALREYELAAGQGLAIIIVTARKEQWLYHTMLWLVEQGIEWDELFMRADDDNRKDYLVKEDILGEIKARGYEPVLAVDDNPAILAVWKRHGIETVRVPGWEE